MCSREDLTSLKLVLKEWLPVVSALKAGRQQVGFCFYLLLQLHGCRLTQPRLTQPLSAACQAVRFCLACRLFSGREVSGSLHFE